MALKLYNTLTRAKEDFVALDPSHVRMYVCGPTVYDLAHIGNARPVVVFDVLYRLLRRLYPAARVTYVSNITDIDDKIIEAHRRTGEPIAAITERTGRQYNEDMGALGILPFDHQPRATEHIAGMIAMIERLIASGNAYEGNGEVLFHVPSMPEYGRLSRHSRDELIAGARVDVASHKRDPADFVLWKPSTPDIPGWDSPWGRGRPGWHIECSAMAERYLGETFDIHGGGQDLIFPHHENELAQSRCAYGTDLMARYWMHNGYLTVEGEKMSKSLGNYYTVHDLLKEVPGEAIRLSLLVGHYRQPLDFSKEALGQARAQLNRLYGALRGRSLSELDYGDVVQTNDPVQEALEDDLNTADALHFLHVQAKLINKTSDDKVKLIHQKALRRSAHLLGLLQEDPEHWFKKTAEVVTIGRAVEHDLAMPITPIGGVQTYNKVIDEIVRSRSEARDRHDFAEADRIRDLLKNEHGVVVEDTPDGPIWRREG